MLGLEIEKMKLEIELIKSLEKDLKLADAKSQYYYNLAGAKAQADQMYNQSMGQFMTEDYFTGRREQHDYNMFDRQSNLAKELKHLDFDHAKEVEYVDADIAKELKDYDWELNRKKWRN